MSGIPWPIEEDWGGAFKHHITEGFHAGRLTSSRVLSHVSAALYLSLIFQPSSEDVSPRWSQRTMGTGRGGGRGADELGLQELEGRRLAQAICSGTSCLVHTFAFTMPPQSRIRIPLGLVPGRSEAGAPGAASSLSL